MKILLMGPQGCGKGTQGERLSEKLHIPLVGAGNLLRSLTKSHPRYTEVMQYINAGNLAPFELVADLLVDRVSQPDCANGYLLDGWARDMGNLGFFDPGFDKVLVFNISRETSIKRITGRRICETDGKTYNIYTLPEEELAKCKGAFIQREDDTEEAVSVRLDVYYTKTIEVIEHFKLQGISVEVDAEGTPDEVFEAACKALDI